MNDLQYYEELLRGLHTNMQRGKPAPHKAFLLLSIIDLIEEGKIYDTRIILTEELEHHFNCLWKKLLRSRRGGGNVVRRDLMCDREGGLLCQS